VGFVLHTAFMGRTQVLAENKNPRHKKAPWKTTGPFSFPIFGV
jgi:hypothetical protein